MNFKDNGIILARRNIKENLAIVTVLTRSYGLYSAIIKNTHNKKNIATYQVGNIVDFYWNARLRDHLGTAICELIKSYSHIIMSSKQNLFYIQSLIELTLKSFKEKETHLNLFNQWIINLNSINMGNISVKNYINFELFILKEAGYSLYLNKCVVTNSEQELVYVSPKSGQAVSKTVGEPYKDKLLPLPKFLISKSEPRNLKEIEDAFNLTAYFFNRYIIQNKKLPIARTLLLENLRLNIY